MHGYEGIPLTWKSKFQCKSKFYIPFKICGFYYSSAISDDNHIPNVDTKLIEIIDFVSSAMCMNIKPVQD